MAGTLRRCCRKAALGLVRPATLCCNGDIRTPVEVWGQSALRDGGLAAVTTPRTVEPSRCAQPGGSGIDGCKLGLPARASNPHSRQSPSSRHRGSLPGLDRSGRDRRRSRPSRTVPGGRGPRRPPRLALRCALYRQRAVGFAASTMGLRPVTERGHAWRSSRAPLSGQASTRSVQSRSVPAAP